MLHRHEPWLWPALHTNAVLSEADSSVSPSCPLGCLTQRLILSSWREQRNALRSCTLQLLASSICKAGNIQLCFLQIFRCIRLQMVRTCKMWLLEQSLLPYHCLWERTMRSPHNYNWTSCGQVSATAIQ